MSREIKFRAWDGVDMMYMPSLKNVQHCVDQDYELMQYTAIKDKNGTPIYEGDIVERMLPDNKLHWRRKVSFFEGAFIAGAAMYQNALIGFNCPKYLEVIGNIYEHKHLLENDHE